MPAEKTGPRSLADVFGSGTGALHDLARRAEDCAGLTALLRDGLPGGLGQHVAGATVEADGTLVVSAASGVWASRLRYEETTLLRLCAGKQPEVRRIRVRVARDAGPAAAG